MESRSSAKGRAGLHLLILDSAEPNAARCPKPSVASAIMPDMAKLTRDHQVRTVVEGLALGTLALGVEAVTAGKMDLEFAIDHALRHWSYADAFPSLSGNLGPNYVWLGIRKSERRRQAYAAWQDGQWLQPYITIEDWSVEDCTNVLGKQGPVPHDGWLELGRLFLDELGEEKVRQRVTHARDKFQRHPPA